jgi:nitroimidazol reductase NimA-like FMN-containing flavoprotein (pyridoxamine 5'-phosphate oxidase superfamily)
MIKGYFMRRQDKEITSQEDLEAIIAQSAVCRLAMIDGDEPYIVPMNFGYAGNQLYFHSARQGRKIDILRRSNRVCFEFDVDHQVVEAERACKWGFRFQSVIGTGTVDFIDEPQAKHKALHIIMGQYSDQTFEFDERAVNTTVVFRVTIESMTGKRS